MSGTITLYAVVLLVFVTGWNSKTSGSTTHEIGTKSANELGIYDMSGNAYEWCWDKYGAYGAAAQVDPKGVAAAGVRVIRGGSFLDVLQNVRVVSRGFHDPASGHASVGFRCVRH